MAERFRCRRQLPPLRGRSEAGTPLVRKGTSSVFRRTTAFAASDAVMALIRVSSLRWTQRVHGLTVYLLIRRNETMGGSLRAPAGIGAGAAFPWGTTS